nr:CrcB family protein [Lysinibacillus timonensis]
MINWIQVLLGGMTGAVLRFIVQSLFTTTFMLWFVNILGSFLLGSFTGFYERRKFETLKLYFTTGLLGAFTTFSTFSEQWFSILRDDVFIGLIFGIVMTVTCVLAAMIGYRLFRGDFRWNG